MKRNYIGFATTYHDPSLAIVDSKGELVFAEATERYMQNKRAMNCIPDDLNRIEKLIEKYCEKDIDELVLSGSWSKGFIDELASNVAKFKPLVESGQEKVDPTSDLSIHNLLSMNQSVTKNLKLRVSQQQNPYSIIDRSYNHHLTHAAAACYSSPFEEAVCLVIDGYGEHTSTCAYHYKDGQIIPFSEIASIKQVNTEVPMARPSSTSLGVFYGYVCHICGFDPWKGEEWKVMGLAPYGEKDEEVYRILKGMIAVDGYMPVPGESHETAYDELGKYFRKPGTSPLESANVAYTGQLVFCELLEEILGNLHQYNLSENLIIGGGCALNSAANGKVLDNTPFKDLHVFSAPADDGNSVGAAFLAYYEDNPPQKAPARYQTPYLGDELSAKSLENLQKFSGLKPTPVPEGKIHEKAAELLAEGKIIGWVQGRAEFGPRALGNRSILADPRRADMEKILNGRVKFREEFRPFAPSILHEHGPEYFEHYQDTPYMERALKFRDDAQDKVPAVFHKDGTGRLQSVKRENNERYYDLISAFHKKTGVPVLINTSFNVMGKPIIHSVEDAIAVFFTSGLDALVLGDLLYEKA